MVQQNSCRKASKPASIFYAPNVFCFCYFIVPCVKFRSPFLGKAQQLQEQLHTHVSVCSIFLCPMAWLPVLGMLCMWLHMWMHCHCKSLHWKLTLGEKSFAATGTWIRIGIAPGFSVRPLPSCSCPICSTNWAIPIWLLSNRKHTRQSLKKAHGKLFSIHTECKCKSCWLIKTLQKAVKVSIKSYKKKLRKYKSKTYA